MELAKSFDPADIERRLYPEWDARGYFNAGLDTSKHDNFCILLPRLHELLEASLAPEEQDPAGD